MNIYIYRVEVQKINIYEILNERIMCFVADSGIKIFTVDFQTSTKR